MDAAGAVLDEAAGLVALWQRDLACLVAVARSTDEHAIAIGIRDDRVRPSRVTSMLPPLIGTPHGGGGFPDGGVA